MLQISTAWTGPNHIKSNVKQFLLVFHQEQARKLQATLVRVRNYDRPTDSLTVVRCSVAKNLIQYQIQMKILKLARQFTNKGDK